MKKILGRLYPYLYLIKTFHHSLVEILVQMGNKKRHQKDWDDLLEIYPFLEKYDSSISSVRDKLLSSHKKYISKISVDFVSTGIEASCFLDFFAHSFKAKSILDLGSGFSTLIFKKYAEENRIINTYAVDESDFWLDKTKQYLVDQGLDTENLMTENDFKGKRNLVFDLIYVDIGDYRQRLSYISSVFDKNMLMTDGCVILDDFHIFPYRKAVHILCSQHVYRVFSLRNHTQSRLKYLALIKK